MADENIHRRRRHRGGHGTVVSDRKRRHSRKQSSPRSTGPSGGVELADSKPVTVDELRKLRVDYHTRSPEEKKKTTMKYVYEPRDQPKVRHVKRASSSTRPGKVTVSDYSRSLKERRVHARENNDEFVYRPRSEHSGHDTDLEVQEVRKKASRKRSSYDDSRHRHPVRRTTSQTSRSHVSNHTSTSVSNISERERAGGSHRRTSHGHLEVVEEDCEPAIVSRVGSHHDAEPHRPALHRSATSAVRSKADTASVRRSVPARSYTEPSIRGERKASSVLGTLFGGSSATHVPEKKITCLTCMADDVPVSKSAKLPCTHRMCHDCLRRIFKLSLTDPAHMPPRCCTTDHIPLKHVDKLFDMKFKVKWNHKFQEYTTRNRIYCPSRGCGEWIKPAQIIMEHGRKVGTCKRCRTRVCCTCNNKMHKSKECPKDEATKQFIETAKKEGWQRCYNCSAMVELKEGCNHMTCRCTAEFCMICGLKWKTCDCPWFNYNAVEADRLFHMNIPQARHAYANGDGRAPLRYQEELGRRREQELRDEEMARRMQGVDLDNDPDEDDPDIGIVGIGNAGQHFLNQDFVQQARQMLAGNIRQAHQAADAFLNGAFTGRENPLPAPPFDPPDAPPGQPGRIRRHHSAASRAYNAAPTTRPSERVIPARRTTDYAAEAARHRPQPQAAAEEDLPSAPTTAPTPSRRRSILARRNTTAQRGPARNSTTSGLIGQADPSTTETDRRIQNWRNDVVVDGNGNSAEA